MELAPRTHLKLSREEVLEWLKKAPFRNSVLEVRQVFSDDDFGDAFTPELRAQEQTASAQRVAQSQCHPEAKPRDLLFARGQQIPRLRSE